MVFKWRNVWTFENIESKTKSEEWQSARRRRESRRKNYFFLSGRQESACTDHVKIASVSPDSFFPRTLLSAISCQGHPGRLNF